MKKLVSLSFLLLFGVVFLVRAQQNVASRSIDYTHLQDKSFEDLFVEIAPEKLPESIFKLVGKDYTVITAGVPEHYNSMVAGDGGVGLLMGKPVTFCGLRGNRYTLELILKDKKYTMTYFDDQFKPAFLPFGQTSGRDTDKMKKTTLTPLVTPSGRISYKEAKIIIECDLAETHTVNLDEVYAQQNRAFYEDAFKSVGAYHKIVFGDIIHIWVRK
jgi:flavin reductase (DIM6/NTAB) family NADH-FMN oxidoreductase RutF